MNLDEFSSLSSENTRFHPNPAPRRNGGDRLRACEGASHPLASSAYHELLAASTSLRDSIERISTLLGDLYWTVDVLGEFESRLGKIDQGRTFGWMDHAFLTTRCMTLASLKHLLMQWAYFDHQQLKLSANQWKRKEFSRQLLRQVNLDKDTIPAIGQITFPTFHDYVAELADRISSSSFFLGDKLLCGGEFGVKSRIQALIPDAPFIVSPDVAGRERRIPLDLSHRRDCCPGDELGELCRRSYAAFAEYNVDSTWLQQLDINLNVEILRLDAFQAYSAKNQTEQHGFADDIGSPPPAKPNGSKHGIARRHVRFSNHTQVRMETVHGTALHQNERPIGHSQFSHSEDFRSVVWNGTAFAFTANQARCVGILWKAWLTPNPEIGDSQLLSDADLEGRLRDIFRKRTAGKAPRHPAWNSMIIEGRTKGTHRIAGDPPSKN